MKFSQTPPSLHLNQTYSCHENLQMPAVVYSISLNSPFLRRFFSFYAWECIPEPVLFRCNTPVQKRWRALTALS